MGFSLLIIQRTEVSVINIRGIVDSLTKPIDVLLGRGVKVNESAL